MQKKSDSGIIELKIMNTQYISKISIIAVAMIFMFVAFFGLNLSMISHDPDMMPGCPFMNNESALCTMSVVEHFSEWQKMFIANIISQISNIFFILYAIAVFTASILLKQLLVMAYKYKLYRIEHPDINYFKYYQYFFSQGILHPKIFS